MKKILVPIDFSDNAQNALHVAADLAVKSGAVLEMLHVDIASIYSTPLSDYAVAMPDATADRNYDETAGVELEKRKMALLSMPEYAKLTIQTRVQDGYLYACVRNVAVEDNVDLVVMGTKGASGVSEFLVGSNTEKVIRTSPCPVLAVPANTEKFDPKIVLLPSTLKNDQSGVFRYVAQWEKMYDFLVKVLYINNPSGLPTDGSAEALKNRFAEAAGLKKTDVVLTSESFFEDNTILAAADQVNADLIVMATHQRQGLSHVLFGSITEDTVNHSNIPVLAVPVAWHVN